MKKLLNILNKKTVKNESEFNLDQILRDHNIDYSNLDFENINVDILKSYNNLNKKIRKNPRFLKNIKSLIPFVNYKAILKPAYTIILTTIVIFAVIEYKNINKDVEYAEITVDKGEKITLHITDNITVWLNSASTIKIPMELKRNAKIFLDGEAYFEIKKGNQKTPEIISKNLIFKTKQGAFNINSKHDNNQLVSNIKEGNIEIYNPNLPKSTTLIVRKGEKVTYNPIAEFISVEKEKNINYLAWKTGILNFDKTSVKEVSEIISSYFDIPIQVINQDLKYKKFTASFKNADIDEILDKLQLSFNCEISGDGCKLVIN